MIQVLIIFKEVILQALQHLGIALSIFIPSLGLVYLFGRMLEVLKTDKAKNSLAMISIYSLSYLYMNVLYAYENILTLIWDVIFYGSFATILYVLIGFTLYNRYNNWESKKFAPDKPTRRKKKS